MRGRSLSPPHKLGLWKETVGYGEGYVCMSCNKCVSVICRSEKQALGTEEGAKMLGEYV